MNDNVQTTFLETVETSLAEKINDSYAISNMLVKFLTEEDRMENGIQKNIEKFKKLKACEKTIVSEYQFENFKLDNFKKVFEQSQSKKSAIRVSKQESKLERLKQKVSSIKKKNRHL
jgi:hypothetical protein